MVSETGFSCDAVSRELWLAIQYLTHCCALKRTGTFASESKVRCLFYLILRSDVLKFIPDINHCVNSCFDTGN